MVPNLDDPAWVWITSELIAKLARPKTVEWIKQWVRDNPTKSCDYLNMLAYLSIKGLATSCYNGQNQTYWVVIGNVPHGWSTSKVDGDPIVRTGKKARIGADDGSDGEDVNILTEIR